MHKKIISIILSAALTMTGCSAAGTGENGNKTAGTGGQERETDRNEEGSGSGRLQFEADPETFAVTVLDGDTRLLVSLPGEYGRAEEVQSGEGESSWSYPEKELKAAVRARKDYLEVEFGSSAVEDNGGDWPRVKGDVFYLPLGEGKRVPGQDKRWQEYLTGMDFSMTESLSMPFFAVSQGDKAILYIIEDPYRTELHFEASDGLELELRHRYPEINPEKTKRFRIYVTDDDPVKIAGIYKQYAREQGKLVTLEEKAAENPDIRKLYGAAHFYLWCGRAISPEDINWAAFRKEASGSGLRYLADYVKNLETGSAFGEVLDEIGDQDYVSQYQKNVICRGITEAVKGRDFYDSALFPEKSGLMEELLGKDVLDGAEQILFNKSALYENLSGCFNKPEQWGLGESAAVIEEMKNAGIEAAFVGLDNWENAWLHPRMPEAAVKAGYLTGPYDSYHSIHEPGKEQWNTAAFEDTSLYWDAAVQNAQGEMVKGFNNVGRKLNPVLSLPSVRQRTEMILSTGTKFNAWFVDCDAAGEIYDDYTPSHRTTMEQDAAARVERLNYIGKRKNMVTGSEGGNDYAASAIAFAHGIELPSFSWRDKDMKENKDSEFYIGRYYSASGGVPEHFGKKIPVKEEWSHIFTDVAFDVPLYRLVYNNAVITTYHWDWSTLKIRGEEKNRMMREVLYNVPPLYHLDRESWDRDREAITSHISVWSDFARNAVQEEMTDFQYLSEDRRVQRTAFGDNLEAVANFSAQEYPYKDAVIQPGGVLIRSGSSERLYYPQAQG